MLKRADPAGSWDLPEDLDSPTREVRLATGECARVRTGEAGEALEILSAQGELVFSYDPATRVTRLVVPRGDLQLFAVEGNIDLNAGGDIRVRGEGAVDIQGQRLRLGAPRAEITIDTLTYAGRRLRANLGEAKLALDKLRVVADTVRQRARDVYQEITDLAQTRAGRVRTLVEDTYQVKAQDLILDASRDTKIDGEQIYIG
jgi:hypothetical protein